MRKGRGKRFPFPLKITEREFLEAEKEGSSREFFFKLVSLLSNGTLDRTFIKSLSSFDLENLIMNIVVENGLEPYFDLKNSKNIFNALRKALRAKFNDEQERVWESKLSNWRAEFEHKVKFAAKRYYFEAGGIERVKEFYKHGWVVPSYVLTDYGLNFELFASQFKRFLSKEFLERRVQTWISIPAFKRREKILKDSVKAFILNCIELSIYSLFAQVEGVVWDFFVRGNFLESDIESLIKKRNRKFVTVQYALRVILEEVFGEDVNIPYYLDWVKFIDFKDDGTLNRHVVQHGVSVNFGTDENFLRLFLLLDFLYEIFTFSS
jgi:hypothetical protein